MKPTRPDSKIRRVLSKRWYSMMDRCNNPDHPRYSEYGGCGVTVCDEWTNKEVFIQSVKELPGYDETALLNGQLHLDKDTVVAGNKIYSPETCGFIDRDLNNKTKPNQMFKFIGISPNGVVYESNNQSEFALAHGLSQNKISYCLNGKQASHKGWTFKYL